MGKIYLYNTGTKKKQNFKPQKKGEVLFYHCGPTVYWTQHIGNLRGMFCGDIVRRAFEYNGYKVKYVRNYTDVGHLTSDEDGGEDKMEKAAKRDKKSPDEIANFYIKSFEEDVKELNLLEPTKTPRATKYIRQMQKMVEVLLEKGFAYQTELAIYFNTKKAKSYTRLSGQILEKNRMGFGRGDASDPNKKNSADFAIWFFKKGAHKNALQTWKFGKYGEGFPGWHIECSAMSKKLLGDTIDVHMGGVEHISVHHTNEIAQSEAANGAKYVKYWLHNEHLLVDNKKMSKSVGTSFSLAEIKEKGFDPLVLRYFFLSAQYRSKQNFTWSALEAAQKGLRRLRGQIASLGNKKGKVVKKYKDKFLKKINDDFNTPGALAVLQEVLKAKLSDQDKLATILDFDKVLGLKNFEGQKDYILTVDTASFKIKFGKVKLSKEVEKLKEERETARKEKNWKESDRLRDEIKSLGYNVEDGKDGTTISPK